MWKCVPKNGRDKVPIEISCKLYGHLLSLSLSPLYCIHQRVVDWPTQLMDRRCVYLTAASTWGGGVAAPAHKQQQQQRKAQLWRLLPVVIIIFERRTSDARIRKVMKGFWEDAAHAIVRAPLPRVCVQTHTHFSPHTKRRRSSSLPPSSSPFFCKYTLTYA